MRLSNLVLGSLMAFSTVHCASRGASLPPNTAKAYLGMSVYVAPTTLERGGGSCPAITTDMHAALQAAFRKYSFNVVGNSAEPHDVVVSARTGAMYVDGRSPFVRLILGHDGTAIASAEHQEDYVNCTSNDNVRAVAEEAVANLLSKEELVAFARTTHKTDPPAPPTIVPIRDQQPKVSPTVGRPSFATGARQPNAWAFVIGIEKYRDIPAAKGARADAVAFAELARTTLGVKEENIKMALDERASRADIISELQWLIANVTAGWRVYFYYSGHGAPDASSGAPYIVPYDGSPSALDTTAIGLDQVMNSCRDPQGPAV